MQAALFFSPIQIVLILLVSTLLGLVFANRLRMDHAALAIAATLGLIQYLGFAMLGPANTPKEAVKAITGFGQPVIVTLISLFILTRGLEKSGATYWLARRLIKAGGASTNRLIILFAGATAVLSLFMNNLAAGALILPSAMEVARRTGIKPSKLLIPVAYGSLLGGAATYFTTANIIVSDLLHIATPPQTALRIYDFTPTGGLIAIAGLIFLAYYGNRLLPDHPLSEEQQLTHLTGTELEDVYGLGDRLWEGRLNPGSELIGKSLAEAGIGHRLGVEVAAVWHGRQAVFMPQPEFILSRRDILLLVGREERVATLCEQGVSIGREQPSSHISPLGVAMLEILPAPRSQALGQTLKEIDFRRRYGFTVVALRRLERSYRTDVGDLKLELGDSLLVIGMRDRINKLQNSADFIVLQPGLSDQPLDRRRAATTVGAIAAGIIASVLGVPTYLAMLLAAVAVLLTGVIGPEEAYQSIEWQAIFLIAGMYAVSLAMVQTGLADLLGQTMIHVTARFGPLGLAAGAYILTSLLTQVMGGQVTALVTGPVAISAAIGLGVSPQAIAVATAIGCSASFLTPLAHPVNILMIAPANYTFKDFFRVGWRLTLISFVFLLLGMVLFWHLGV